MLTDVVKMISLPALFITGSVGAVRSQLTRYLSLLMATQKHPVKSRMLSLSLLSMTSRLNLRIYRSHMPYALVIPLQLRSPLRYFQSVSVMVLTRPGFKSFSASEGVSVLGDISGLENIYIVCGYTDMRKSIDGLHIFSHHI